jgi:hypothetical protein
MHGAGDGVQLAEHGIDLPEDDVQGIAKFGVLRLDAGQPRAGR